MHIDHLLWASGLFLASIGFLLWVLQRLLRLGQVPAAARRQVWQVLLGWMAYTTAMAATGTAHRLLAIPPVFAACLLLPPLGVLVVLLTKGRLDAFLRTVPTTALVWPQVFRLAIELFLWGMLLAGIVPVQMTLEGYNFDILVGLTAPVVALLALRGRAPRGLLLGWNVLGLLLVTTIVVISILSAPGPLRQFANDPANTFIADWPYVWLPTVAVAAAYWLHALALRQLWLTRQPAKAVQLETAG